MIFIKGVRYFEAKKAINYELEAHSHGGGEKKNGDRENGRGSGQNFGEKKGKSVGFFDKLVWLIC